MLHPDNNNLRTTSPLKLPADIDWRHWVERWDRMQERYLVRRAERVALIVGLIQETVDPVSHVLDLGCGTGTLMEPMLQTFPAAEIHGIDFDPVLLPLAQERLRSHGARAHLHLTDLRAEGWPEQLPGSFDAVVSATALHWFTEAELAGLYRQLTRVLRPGGLFLNADHVGSRQPKVQAFWERNRDVMRRNEGKHNGEDWDRFWEAYARALGLAGQRRITERVLGGWAGGVEEGLPLEWHVNQLKANGFTHIDCFWRCDCDAIYGGFH